jgi:hypothetical protein
MYSISDSEKTYPKPEELSGNFHCHHNLVSRCSDSELAPEFCRGVENPEYA